MKVKGIIKGIDGQQGEQGIQGVQGVQGQAASLQNIRDEINAQKNVPAGIAGVNENSRISPAQLPLGVWTKIAQASAPGDAEVTFTGLDIRADGGMYHIEIYGTGTMASSINMHINGDFTDTNYRSKVGVASGNYARIALIDAVFTAVVLDLGLVTVNAETKTPIATGSSTSLGTTTISAVAVSWAKISAINNITSITFGLTSGYLSNKTVITIWKKG